MVCRTMFPKCGPRSMTRPVAPSRRQLESMKPRPSDEMIERQMVKLEAAITEVEDDHAEALAPP